MSIVYEIAWSWAMVVGCKSCWWRRFPMAAPGGEALGSTRRGSRYRSLSQQVSQAVGVASRTDDRKEQADDATAIALGSGMEEVRHREHCTTMQGKVGLQPQPQPDCLVCLSGRSITCCTHLQQGWQRNVI